MDKIQIDKFIASLLNPSENTRSKLLKLKVKKEDGASFVESRFIIDLFRGALDDQGLEFNGSEIINKI